MENIKFGLRTIGSGTALDLFSILLFLFFIQQITFLIESIYMMNLLHKSMDSNAFGLLLLAMPVLLFFIGHNKSNYIIIVSLMLFSILLSPVLPTPIRIFSSGLGAGSFLLYFALQYSDRTMPAARWGLVAALATLASIAFRATGHSLDISISGNTKFIAWILVLIAIVLFSQIIKEYPLLKKSHLLEENGGNSTVTWFSILGLAGSVLLIFFAFSSPGVIARWTEGNYILINVILCFSILIFIVFGSAKILRHSRLKELLLILNSIFLLSLIWTILLHKVPFPALPESAPVVIGEVSSFSQIVTYLMLILSPVIFINIAIFSYNIKPTKPSKLAGPFSVAVILMILCVFMLILSNGWGYTRPISFIFRNQFHLPFAIAGIFMILPSYFFIKRNKDGLKAGNWSPLWSKVLSLLLVVLCCSAVISGNKKQVDLKIDNINELKVMTYNVQQGVDMFGNKNYEGQLELIKEINPDIICMQESDASRISGGNSDVVRYFSENLGFYTYYGPKTVSGTFGTAIISRFPLRSCRTIFTYSTKDEIGTAVAMISLGNQDITLINSHPAGKIESREAHINVVEQLSKENGMVIALGDYNFKQKSPYYQKITKILNNAWQTKYPDAIGSVESNKLDYTIENRKKSSGFLLPGGKLDMQNRIDHIFLSKDFEVVEAHYLPAPESGTDHPVHWAVVRW